MKVIDLSTDVAGQWAAKLFAMGGAEVIRPVPREGPAPLAAYLASGTQAASWSGAEMLADADIVFTSFDRGAPTGLAKALEIPARSIHVVTSTFGMTGPYAAYRGGPLAGWAAGGYLALTGEPERGPVIGPEHLCEYVGGYTAAIAAEAALYRRSRTGEGATIDISTMEAMLCVHQTTFADLALGNVQPRRGIFYGQVYPMSSVRCRKGYVKLCCVTEEECDRFLTAIGRADLLADERFANTQLRFDNRDSFDAEITGFLETHDAEDIVRILEDCGVAAAKVATVSDVRSNPQLAFRGFWNHGLGPGNPIPPVQRFAPPRGPIVESALARIRSKDLPLAGLVVADFTVFWAGPSAARMLADLGARVIWVERPGSRRRWRVDEDPASADVGDHYNLEISRNKESIVLDLRTTDGLAAANTLIANSDIVIENNRPGVMDKLGLGAAEICARHPHIVYVSLSGYGNSGPWAVRRSYGPTIEGSSGIEGRTGYEGDGPMRLGHPLPDATGGLAGALAALRGLRERKNSGAGGWFDISQLESYVAMSGEDLVEGKDLERIGNRSRWGARQGVYPCLGDDDWIAIRLNDDDDCQRLSEITGLDAPDEGELAAFTSLQDKGELTERLQKAGIEAFPALRPDEFVDDPHMKARDFFVAVPFGDKIVRFAGSPYRPLADTSGPSTNFGDNTAELLEEIGRVVRIEEPIGERMWFKPT